MFDPDLEDVVAKRLADAYHPKLRPLAQDPQPDLFAASRRLVATLLDNHLGLKQGKVGGAKWFPKRRGSK